jgi:PAS domain S-box-containing protein
MKIDPRVMKRSAQGKMDHERSQLYDVRNFLASIVDTSDDAILSKDLDGFILSWNEGAERLYGYSPVEVIGKHISILVPPELPDDIPHIMSRLKLGLRIDHYETVRLKKDGSRVNISLTVSPVKDIHGNVIAASAIGRDITARIRIEEEKAHLMEELSRSLSQKNTLLQEVYHRVKNNLQVISSLLDLRSRYAMRDPAKAAAAFKESIERIRAMALVHEKLYKTDDLQKLNFSDYLRTLIEQLLRTYAINKRIEHKISGDLCEFELNTAIPLGLIFNELVMNSMKYAFTSSQKGTIEIRCRGNNESLDLHYSDNGVGLPEDIDFLTSDSFGFRIVRLLAKQLNAKISVSREKGTSFQITIPKRDGRL